MKLLLVEDEKQLSEALQQILIKNKYTVDAVYNGDEGLDLSLIHIYWRYWTYVTISYSRKCNYSIIK